MHPNDTLRSRLDRAAISMFARHGVAGTSVRDIAQSAGIADGTLYRHYSSKERMARELFERHYTALARTFEDCANTADGLAAKLRAIIEGAYRLFDEEPDLFGFLLLSQHDHLDAIGEVEASPVDVVRDLICDAMRLGELPRSDPEQAAALAFGIALQPAVFTVYGRLEGPLAPRAGDVASACAAALGVRAAHG